MSVTKHPQTPANDEILKTSSGFHPSATQINLNNRYIAYCGNDCSECPQYQTSCAEGCLGNKCTDYCGLCEVRICGLERGVINCGYCKEYPCQKLENQYVNMGKEGYGDWAKNAKTILDEISSMRKS